jgi:deoxyribodipyrimidine photo-lyase
MSDRVFLQEIRRPLTRFLQTATNMAPLTSSVPDFRVQTLNTAPVREERPCVLYWMVAARRVRFNFALERAADWARELGLPLLVLEALRCDYPWASARFHRFILDGMADNRAALERCNALYYPFIEQEKGAGRGLLAELARRAAVVVTDDFPTFFLPRMAHSAAERVDVRLETVDSNGLIPMSVSDGPPATAYVFRRLVQRQLLEHLEAIPLENPLEDLPGQGELPSDIVRRWQPAPQALFDDADHALAPIPLDHSVTPTAIRGGTLAAGKVLAIFLVDRLDRYGDDRNRPDDDATSGLSPYLHFGHVSAHEVFLEVMRRERWLPDHVVPPANGRRAGWWAVSPAAEGFLDQLITWRELGFHFCHHRDDHDRYESLPDWVQRTLAKHAGDPREYLYSLDEFDGAGTHDPLWNAAQNQLRREGRIHNYLRMLWGKKILEWTREPREALEFMIELNNRYALDGRDPNSVTGIFWVLGRHDRPWGPERPVFGTVRYMSSANTARKVSVRRYLEQYS